MFQFRRFPTYTYFVQCTLSEYCSDGFPHSEIRGSMLMCSSPQLIAACHVLHRLLMPRHSPCALISLTFVEQPISKLFSSSIRIMQASVWFIVVFVTLQFILKSPQKLTLLPLCCLLAISCLLHCSVFKVQLLTFSKVRSKYLSFKHFDPILWWRLPGSNR